MTQISWPGILVLVLMAISAGVMMAWIYTIMRLAQIF
jgi:hypothetical protein